MTPNEKLVWAAAFAAEMQYSARPGLARWTAYKAVMGMRLAHEYRDYETKLRPEALHHDYEMLEEMRRDA